MGDHYQLQRKYKLLDALNARKKNNPLVNHDKIEDDLVFSILRLEEKVQTCIA